jgi:hypothetical protein
MNVFRLVLCLTGLTIYLVVKQFLHSEPNPTPRVPASPSVPEALSKPDCEPRGTRPQTKPHTEFLKPDTSFADARR